MMTIPFLPPLGGAARRAEGGLGAALLLLLLAACAQPEKVEPSRGPVPADGSIRIVARAVPLNPEAPAQTQLGQLTYAGGVALTSPDTERLHGLSGIDLADDGLSFLANSDEGDLLRGRLVLDANGRLTGVDRAVLTPLRGENGEPLQGKEEGDAEDITLLPDGGFAVSFERDHRVLRYARAGAPGALVARFTGHDENFRLTENGGVESITTGPGDTLIVGSEDGDIRTLKDGKLVGPQWAPPPPGGFKLTSLKALPGGDWLALYRAYDPFQGARAVIAVLPQARCIRAPCEAPHGLIELGRLARPLTVDNFEGIAAAPLKDGRGWRIYILADDNFSDSERTLLLAFDWRR